MREMKGGKSITKKITVIEVVRKKNVAFKIKQKQKTRKERKCKRKSKNKK